MPGLPGFDEDGLLPPGEYPLTLDQLRRSTLVHAPRLDRFAAWDSPWRASLVERLGVLARQLWSIGIEDVFVNGSFAEDKGHPNDIDGYFVCDASELLSGRLERRLNQLDPFKVWT